MAENEKSFCKRSVENRQEISVFAELKDGKIEKIHNAFIYQPAINFKGGSVKWHEDRVRK